MSAPENEATIRSTLEDVFTGRNLGGIDRAFAPDAAFRGGPPGAGPGPAGYRRYARWLLGVTSDLQLTVEDQLAEGDRVATRARVRGTQTGPVFGFPPSGRPFSLTAFWSSRLAGGKIAELVLVENRVGWLQQLGHLPPPQRPFIPPPAPPAAWPYGPAGSPAANAAVVRRLLEEAWDRGDFAVLDELVVPDAIDHNPFPGEPPGLVGIQQMLRETRAAFPDYRELVAETVAEGDRVAARREVSVTHRGAYLGIPPTGRRGRMTGMAIFRLAGGRVVERWGEFDLLHMLQDLGVVPPLRLDPEGPPT